jgi:hypothetical protein
MESFRLKHYSRFAHKRPRFRAAVIGNFFGARRLC